MFTPAARSATIEVVTSNVFFIAALIVIVSVIVTLTFLRFRVQVVRPQAYERQPDPGSYTIIKYVEVAPFNRRSSSLSDQSYDWRQAMRTLGRRLVEADVGAITLAHGTFVGNDPLSVASFIGRLLPGFGATAEGLLIGFAKLQSDLVMGDNGNFLPEYVELMREALGGTVPCRMFNWGSGNHHLHRLQGAVRLAIRLASARQINGASCHRHLIFGHSHAGQMFAILTQLLGHSRDAAALIDIARLSGEDVAPLPNALRELRKLALDFVTLGTPPRYGWGDFPRYRLLNIVNHRGAEPFAGTWQGLLHTLHGDYVQQWGIAGSDLLAGSQSDRELNTRLNAILGEGFNPKAWLENARYLVRVPSHGHTYLVDYDDASRLIANCFPTVFGHGIYTKRTVMLFNLQLAVDHFYL